MRVSCVRGDEQQLRQCVERAARARGYHRVRQRADDRQRLDVRARRAMPAVRPTSSPALWRPHRPPGIPACFVNACADSAFLLQRQLARCARQRGRSSMLTSSVSVCIAPAGQIRVGGFAEVLQRRTARARWPAPGNRVAGAHGALELFEHDGLQAFLDARHQRLARQLRQVGQPFGAPRQHPGDQALQPRPVVVEAPQDPLEGCAQIRVLLRIAQRLARGLRVQIVGCVGDAAAETVARGDAASHSRGTR